MNSQVSPFRVGNVRRFIAFRVFFNSRFYYPVFTILFLDFGLSITQFALLNVVWATTIVVLEVPSGALADLMGRRNLLVWAGVLMVLEMALISFVPRGRPGLVFAAFLVNRVLSGAAEAAASGADEALAYDSLAREGDARDWGRVLDWQIRCQAIGFMLAMSLGAAIYDPTLMQRLADWLGLGWRVTQEATLRLPLYGSLGMALVTLGITLGMKEVPDGPGHEPGRGTGRVMLDAFRLTLRAGMWIVRTPMALAVILFGLLFDHTVRMFLTLTSQYYRMIQLPEAVFGLIGSGMAMVGIFAPRLFLWLSQAHGPAFNAALLGALALAGFWGLSLVLPFWGLVPAVLLIVVMHGQGFLVSRYLNEITESRQRATVLSFKGLSYNLGYGLVGLLYSLLLALLRGRLDPALVPGALGDLENAAFIKSLGWFPWYFALLFAAFWLVSRIRLRGRP